MRLSLSLIMMLIAVGACNAAKASPTPDANTESTSKQVQVSAEQSLEYYQDKHLYVARGKAKAVRGTLTVTADILTAHERNKNANTKTIKPVKGSKSGGGDIEMMTAEGHVIIEDAKQRITGEHAVYDLDNHKMIVTGNNLRYETAKETVTARDSLEYYEDTKMAVARGHAIADQPTRHIEGDVLTAEFRDAPNGQTQLTKLSAQGHVSVVTKAENGGGDVSRGDRAVYDAASNMAVISGDVKISRKDGTQLSGDVGEVDFNNNQNRLMNSGNGRVRALLPSKISPSKP